MGNESEGTPESSLRGTSQRRLTGWVQKDRGAGLACCCHRSALTRTAPAKSAILNAASNGRWERDNPLHASPAGAVSQAHGYRGWDWPRSQGLRESRRILPWHETCSLFLLVIRPFVKL